MSEISGDNSLTQSMINQPNSIFMLNSTASNEESSVYLPSEETLLELILQNSLFCAKAKLPREQNNEITKQKQIEEMNSYDDVPSTEDFLSAKMNRLNVLYSKQLKFMEGQNLKK